jgi:hypothetical protein
LVITDRSTAESYYQQIRDPHFKGAVVSSVWHVAYRNKMHPKDEILNTAAEKLFTFQISIFYPHSSCLIGVVDIYIMHFVSNGLIKHWADSIVPDAYHDSRYTVETKEPQKLTLFQLRGAYKVYGTALGVSFIVFLLELLSKRVRLIRKLMDFWQYKL